MALVAPIQILSSCSKSVSLRSPQIVVSSHRIALLCGVGARSRKVSFVQQDVPLDIYPLPLHSASILLVRWQTCTYHCLLVHRNSLVQPVLQRGGCSRYRTCPVRRLYRRLSTHAQQGWSLSPFTASSLLELLSPRPIFFFADVL